MRAERRRAPGRVFPTTVVVGAVLCLAIAVGAALQGQFSFRNPAAPPNPEQLRASATSEPQPSSAVNTQPPPSTAATPDVARAVEAPDLTLPIVLSIIAALIVIVAGILVIRWLRRRRRAELQRLADEHDADTADQPDDDATDREPDLPTMRRGLAAATEMLGEYREPTDAIVRAWVGLQEAAAESGMRRRPSETPTEFTKRVLGRANADERAADTLLGLYLRARFGARPATVQEVRRAQWALERLSASWPQPEPVPA